MSAALVHPHPPVIGSFLPTTGQAAVDFVLYAAAFVAALAVIWRTAIRPAARAIAEVDQFAPLIPVLIDMSNQFKSNSGSTLKDVVTRLEAAANQNLRAIKAAAERDIVMTASIGELRVQIATLRVEMTGPARQAPRNAKADIADAAEAAADKIKAVAADAAAVLVEVGNPDPIKVQVINTNPIDVTQKDATE